jgi:hypothetical protein
MKSSSGHSEFTNNSALPSRTGNWWEDNLNDLSPKQMRLLFMVIVRMTFEVRVVWNYFNSFSLIVTFMIRELTSCLDST